MVLIMQGFVYMEETLFTRGCGDTAIYIQGKLIQ